jgi:RNase P/RNase MRP subunit p29
VKLESKREGRVLDETSQSLRIVQEREDEVF